MNAHVEFPVRLTDIADVVAEHFGIEIIDLKSQRRETAIIKPRQAAYWLSARLTTKSLAEIGRFWDRDHTTVLYAVRKLTERRARDAELDEELEALTQASRLLAEQRRHPKVDEEAVTPLVAARMVVAATNNEKGRSAVMRAVTRVSANQIVDICREMLRLAQRCEDYAAAEAPPPPEPEPQSPAKTPGGKSTKKLAEAAAKAAAAMRADMLGAVHDFLGAEAVYRRMPRSNIRQARDEAAIRLRRYRAPQVAQLTTAYAAFILAEHTAGERDATQRYLAAVETLANFYKMELAHEDA